MEGGKKETEIFESKRGREGCSVEDLQLKVDAVLEYHNREHFPLLSPPFHQRNKRVQSRMEVKE